MNTRLLLTWFCAVAVVVGVLWFNYINLIEAFGAGPPYYSRTTNMDKWENPIPVLVGVDAAVGLLLFVLFRLGFSNKTVGN